MLRRDLPEEGIYHVTARGVSGQPIFIHDVDRLDFLALFDKRPARQVGHAMRGALSTPTTTSSSRRR